ncbi:MAG: HlyD family efflux transporter periplasmic adaptor subunit [bacterium]|nr:HlyD family efflux transporter periplasmic adaptor subunit [bacterium]
MAITSVNNKKKKKKGLIIGICAVIAAGVIVTPLFMGKMQSGTAGYLSEASTKRTLETYYTFSGNVTSANTQNIMAENILQIKTIHVNEGDKVAVGTVLFTTSDDTKIKSKIDGTVNKIMVEADQQVMSGAQMAEIVDFDNLEISLKIDEYDLDAISIDKKIDVTIGSLNKDIEGTISEISRTATSENGVSYFLATAKLEYDKDVKIGMTAEARILKEEAKDAIVIPMKALSLDNENNPFVYMSDNSGVINKVSVDTGINDGKYIEVKSGLDSSQTVYYKDPDAVQSSGSSFLPPMGGM